ncbi:MAG: TIGR02301 family protein [Pseudomonadota bacterium]
MTLRRKLLTAGLVLAMTLAASNVAFSQAQKPYDKELMRLSEILGAVHYLRELCGSEDGQLWRDQMNELISAEGSSALRRARLTRRFNQGYRSYSRTYNVCTASARTAIERFISEGVELSEGVLKRIP